MTNKRSQSISNEAAIENLRHLGRIFAESMKHVTGKDVEDDSPLMNGLVAYAYLDLKGKWDYLDESVDIVVRIMYKDFIKKYEAEK